MDTKTGQTSGSGSSSDYAKENWNTPIGQLQSKVGTAGNNTDYFLVAKNGDDLQVYSNKSKTEAEGFISGIQSKLSNLFNKEETHS
jgi:hypothetical protein